MLSWVPWYVNQWEQLTQEGYPSKMTSGLLSGLQSVAKRRIGALRVRDDESEEVLRQLTDWKPGVAQKVLVYKNYRLMWESAKCKKPIFVPKHVRQSVVNLLQETWLEMGLPLIVEIVFVFVDRGKLAQLVGP